MGLRRRSRRAKRNLEPVVAEWPAPRISRTGDEATLCANEAHINLRFLHHPPQETDDDEQFGQAPHTDNSFIPLGV